MARFTSAGGGSGEPGPQGPAGEDAVLPQDLDTTDSPVFNKITLTSNGAVDNITIGDDVILGDGNVANHLVIIGQQDDTAGGIVLGTNETEFISTNGTDLSVTADNDIVLYPGSNYAYLNVIDENHRLATMADVTSGTQGEPGPQGDPGEPGADALWNFLGEWQNGVDYAAGSVVQFQGSSYYHPDGQYSSYSPPTNGWLLVSSKGDTGENGADGSDGAPGADGNDGSPGLVYLGNYVSGNGYLANVAVVKGSDNNLYIATSSGGLGDPVGNTAEWAIFLPKGADGVDGEDAETVSETSFTVNGGTLGTQPTFTGAPLFSGTYVKTGPLVHFQIQVDMDNILTFGDGQYYLDLPFPAKYGYQVKEGCLHDDSTGRQYAIGGHVYAGQSTLALTFTNSSGQDEAFDHNSPVTLNVADNFHIAGTYIIN